MVSTSSACSSSSPIRQIQSSSSNEQNTSSNTDTTSKINVVTTPELGKFDSIEYIDQTSISPDIITNNKGYHTIDDDRLNKLKNKSKVKTKQTPNKKKGKKEKAKSLSLNSEDDKKEMTESVKSATADAPTAGATTTSLNRYTFTRIADSKFNSEQKVRTHSCSSIPYDNIIENLAPFRKRFCNMQLFNSDDDDGVPFSDKSKKGKKFYYLIFLLLLCIR